MPFSHIKAFIRTLTESETPHSSGWVTASKFGSKLSIDMNPLGSHFPAPGNTFLSTATSIGPSATAIQFPEDLQNVTLFHAVTSGILFIGNTTTMSATLTASPPLLFNTYLPLVVQAGNENNIYGYSATTLTVYAFGVSSE